jgi:hypothetical protein
MKASLKAKLNEINRKFFKEQTEYMLNHLTLEISNKEVAEEAR